MKASAYKQYAYAAILALVLVALPQVCVEDEIDPAGIPSHYFMIDQRAFHFVVCRKRIVFATKFKVMNIYY